MVRPMAEAVERDWAEASALMVASLRITEGRHRYLSGHVENAALLLRRAVVAAEVRDLAARSASSSADIAGLVGESQSRIEVLARTLEGLGSSSKAA